MKKRISQISLDKLRAEERARQHEKQLVKCHKEAANTAIKHERQIAALSEQIGTMDYYSSPINDDEASSIMNRLQSAVDVWVKANFNKLERLDALASDWCNDERFPRAVYEPGDIYKNQGLVRAIVANHLNDRLFSQTVLGPNPETDTLIKKVMERLEGNQGELDRRWCATTSLAWQNAFREELGNIPAQLAVYIDSSLSKYSVTETQMRQGQLRKIIAQCVNFKKRLERQEKCHGFYMCHPGVAYIPDDMQTVADAQSMKGIVEFCIFPGLWRRAQQGKYSAVQKASVWTRRLEEVEQVPGNK